MKIHIREIGLAAFIALRENKKENFECENGSFVFESEKSKKGWMMEYLKSECYEHDELVMRLRDVVKNNRR